MLLNPSSPSHIAAARYMNEESVGRALKEWTKDNNVPRSEIFITSKLWDADHDKAAAAIEDSLKKLQVEYMTCTSCTPPYHGSREASRGLEGSRGGRRRRQDQDHRCLQLRR